MNLAQQMPYVVTPLNLRAMAEAAQDLGGYPLDDYLLHFRSVEDAQHVSDLIGLDGYAWPSDGGAPIRVGQQGAPAPGQVTWQWYGALVVIDPWVQPGTVEFRRVDAPRGLRHVEDFSALCDCGHFAAFHDGRFLFQADAPALPPMMPQACYVSGVDCPCTRFRRGNP